MSAPPPRMILHLGAPKCGSSALQTALSRQPDHRGTDGTRYAYTALFRNRLVIRGAALPIAARASAYGYVNWPNFIAGDMTSPIFPAIERELQRAGRNGYVPILSSEGWLTRHNAFGRLLARLGHPRIDVVAFLRPPMGWMNAAFWQWGVWGAGTIDRWITHGRLPYTFGSDLEAWSRIPGVRVRFGRSQPDVVHRFADLYGIDLTSGIDSNRSAPAALIEILLRHRHLRPDGNASKIEFIYGRWCPPVDGPRPWAIEARHADRMQRVLERERAALFKIGGPVEIADLQSDPRWSDDPFPLPPLCIPGQDPSDPNRLAALSDALAQGLTAAACAAHRPPPLVPVPNQSDAPQADWEAAIITQLTALLRLDATVRRPGLRDLTRLVWQGHSRSSKSR